MPFTRFRIWPILLLAFIAPAIPAQETLSFPATSGAQAIPATLLKPDGDGPFPAVVIMHDCSGLGPRSSGAPKRWGQDLRRQGYVVLMPDSFSPRGIHDGVCTESDAKIRAASNGAARAADAYGALAALRALTFVDKQRVGIMGGSHGGWATLAAMVAPISDRDPLAGAKRAGFAAAIALYPSCMVRYGERATTPQDLAIKIAPLTPTSASFK
ncbi:MAG: hypothetical protein EXR28_00315 [Betaproteobacteria bacterium]|nr:hypothetical protein [Betaproteobacteria bacterium]